MKLIVLLCHFMAKSDKSFRLYHAFYCITPNWNTVSKSSLPSLILASPKLRLFKGGLLAGRCLTIAVHPA